MSRQRGDSEPLNVTYSRTAQSEQFGHYEDPPVKSNRKKWIWITVLAISLLIVAAVVGGVVGSQNSSKKSSLVAQNSNSGSGSISSGTVSNSGAGSGSVTSAGLAPTNAQQLNAGRVIATATDAHGNPLYPTTTGSAVISAPTTIVDSTSALSCGADPYVFANPPSFTSVRNEHPLLFAAAYKWQCLPKQIAADPYMSYWNETIFLNATKFYNFAPTNYSIDGGLTGSGVLDVAREVQLRIKHWGYAYKMTNDTKWVDRTWLELQTAAGNSTTGQYFGIEGDNWNAIHTLDLAEFTLAFAIGYDWFYEAWTPVQRNAIMWSIINLGLSYGLKSYDSYTYYSWWHTVNGNWNCVCNNGLSAGALAIANEDPTGIAAKVLAYTVPNAVGNCAESPSTDGTWSETPNYWYFGTTGHAQMAQSLIVATGSDYGLMDSNPGMKLSALYHMAVTGMQGLFAYGDTGPNKYTATANGIMFYGSYFNIPMYTLFQRDRGDAPEPMSMLFYDPQVSGQFFDGLAIDQYFPNNTDSWISMRSSWTDTQGTYVAMKGGNLTNHQTHGDLDTGDFVLDALGQRWAGELASGNYLADGYFSSEAQDSERWIYYRTANEGQNSLLLNGDNMNVMAAPVTTFLTTGEVQDALDYSVANSSTALFTIDMTSTYNGTNAHRAIRFLNGRKQVLMQDEITVPEGQNLQWRMQTNATITIDSTGKIATLALNGETLIATIQPTSVGIFTTQLAVALPTDPVLPPGEASAFQPNPGVTVLTIALGPGEQLIQVLFNPQWSNFNSQSYVSPPSVAIADWTLTSHE